MDFTNNLSNLIWNAIVAAAASALAIFIPLDIIWINSDYEVVYISRDTPPCKEDPCQSYTTASLAMYILELNAGTADKIGLKEGDKVQIRD